MNARSRANDGPFTLGDLSHSPLEGAVAGADRVFDREHFSAMTASDEALQLELIGLFRAQAVLWRRLLIPDAPTHTWRDAAHSVKGTARGLGLWALADACETAEALGRAGAVEGHWVDQYLGHVRMRLEEALAALRAEECGLQGRA